VSGTSSGCDDILSGCVHAEATAVGSPYSSSCFFFQFFQDGLLRLEFGGASWVKGGVSAPAVCAEQGSSSAASSDGL
jgi:hypothetical protein